MLRRTLIFFFILANLTSQASIAFSCEMMGGAVVRHCCCHHQHSSDGGSTATDRSKACCHLIEITADQGISGDSAKVAAQLSHFDPSPQATAILPAAVFILPYSDRPEITFSPPPDTYTRFGTLTYLHTQRLRI
jgi:hypothetical protein